MALHSPEELEPLSRRIACILRHRAGEHNLQMDANGWCRLRDLHDILKTSPWTLQHILTVAKTSSKDNRGRLDLYEEDTFIRASGKHSCLVRPASKPSSSADTSEDHPEGPADVEHGHATSVLTGPHPIPPAVHEQLLLDPPPDVLDPPRDVSASSSTGNVPLRHFVSSAARHWRSETWWICEDVPENTFCEEDSGSWRAYKDPKTGRPYWCHETTDE